MSAAEPGPELGAPRRALGVGALLASGSGAVTGILLGVTSVLVARLLGPDGTGQFGVIGATLTILTTLATFGIGIGLTYHVSNRRLAAADALRQAQIGAAVLGLAWAGAGIVLAGTLLGDAYRGISIGTVAIGLLALPFAMSWLFSSLCALAVDRYETYAAVPALQAGLNLVLVAVLAPLFGVEGAVIALACSHLATALGVLLREHRVITDPARDWLKRTFGDLKKASAFGIRADLTNALALLNERADLLILNAFASAASVGHYSIALVVTSSGLLLAHALQAVVFPRVSALDTSEEDEAEQARVMASSVKHAVVLVPIQAVGILALLFAVPLIYGGDFSEATEIGLILLPGTLAIALGGVFSGIVVGKGFANYALYAALVVTPITLALYAVLIPAHGAIGGAIGSSISYTLTTLIMYGYLRRVTGLRALGDLRPGREELADYRFLAGLVRARLQRRGD